MNAGIDNIDCDRRTDSGALAHGKATGLRDRIADLIRRHDKVRLW